jgi:hypothetical protein
MGYSVNHQRGGFQRVNFRVIPSPLEVKALISAEEAMESDLQNLHNYGHAFL